jgi:hypothetical protein
MRRKWNLISIVFVVILLFTACSNSNQQKDEAVDNNESYSDYESSSEEMDYEDDISEVIIDNSDLTQDDEYTYIPITSQYVSVFEDLKSDSSVEESMYMQVQGPQMPAEYVGIWNSLQYPYVELNEYNDIDTGILVEITSDGYISILDAYGDTKREYACILSTPLVDNNGSYSFIFENDNCGNSGSGEISLTEKTLSVTLTRIGEESTSRYNYYGVFTGTETFIKDGEALDNERDLIYNTVEDYFQALSNKNVDSFKSFINRNINYEAQVIGHNPSDTKKDFVSNLQLRLIKDDLMFDPSLGGPNNYYLDKYGFGDDSEEDLPLMDLTEGFAFDESNWSASDIITTDTELAGYIRQAAMYLTGVDGEDRLHRCLDDIFNYELPADYDKSMLVVDTQGYYLVAASDFGYNNEGAYGHYVVFQKVSTGLYKVCFIADYKKAE